jgi:hypothetical protein
MDEALKFLMKSYVMFRERLQSKKESLQSGSST